MHALIYKEFSDFFESFTEPILLTSANTFPSTHGYRRFFGPGPMLANLPEKNQFPDGFLLRARIVFAPQATVGSPLRRRPLYPAELRNHDLERAFLQDFRESGDPSPDGG